LVWHGAVLRAFSSRACVKSRGYSLPLQRAITDFGVEESFVRATARLKEHYRIDVPPSAIREITETHAAAAAKFAVRDAGSEAPVVQCIIAEMDGSMIPMVRMEAGDAQETKDRRKLRKTEWKEARLCVAQAQGSVTSRYGVSFGSTGEAGLALFRTAHQVGFGNGTAVHGVGDGAAWIPEQFEAQFGASASYLLDLFHLCDYLAPVAATCSPSNPALWLENQKQLLKANRWKQVLNELEAHLEPEALPDEQAPARCAHRYISRRTGQLDYAGAIAAELPIGSGLIESAHRHILQQRLKIAGAWWKHENASAIAQLRVLRANHRWNPYWISLSLKAA